ncbi:retroviral-like aspartic protease family protein [Rhizosaccharibacter radicis]|uniref:Retroviral-like aspartic protease family protein n=1 Tax=Rhizosaccharibacter radicis TaxID=2782605 RepID=A0ABT1VZV9_9PROT|nr:retroviral-like aspartic protease family protein [Acetobacteraceae bacterium KSS12]
MLFALAGAAAHARATGPALCERRVAASVALRDDDGFITIPVEVGSRAASMLLDTGSDAGLFTRAGVQRLGLPVDQAHRIRMQGTGGDGRSVPSALFGMLRIGAMTLPGGAMPVGVLPGEPVIRPPVAGLLGADILSHFDLELDLPHGVARFWTMRLGSVACAGPPFWDQPTGAVEAIRLSRLGDRRTLPVQIEGRPLVALLDTGARSRILSNEAAARLGVGADVLGADPGGITAGVDLHETAYHWHRFRSLRIGDTTERDPVLTVAPLAEKHVDMLLGADWFSRRQVWVSYATDTLFVHTPRHVSAAGSRAATVPASGTAHAVAATVDGNRPARP